jgi:hypothetical protein
MQRRAVAVDTPDVAAIPSRVGRECPRAGCRSV